MYRSGGPFGRPRTPQVKAPQRPPTPASQHMKEPATTLFAKPRQQKADATRRKKPHYVPPPPAYSPPPHLVHQHNGAQAPNGIAGQTWGSLEAISQGQGLGAMPQPTTPSAAQPPPPTAAHPASVHGGGYRTPTHTYDNDFPDERGEALHERDLGPTTTTPSQRRVGWEATLPRFDGDAQDPYQAPPPNLQPAPPQQPPPPQQPASSPSPSPSFYLSQNDLTISATTNRSIMKAPANGDYKHMWEELCLETGRLQRLLEESRSQWGLEQRKQQETAKELQRLRDRLERQEFLQDNKASLILTRERAKLKAQAAKFRSERDDALSQLKSRRETVAAAELKSRKTSENKLRRMALEKQRVTKDIGDLRQENKKLRDASELLSKAADDANDRVTALELQNKQLRQASDLLSAASAEATETAEIMRLQDLNKSLRQDYEKKCRDLKGFAAMRRENEQLKQELEECRQENEALLAVKPSVGADEGGAHAAAETIHQSSVTPTHDPESTQQSSVSLSHYAQQSFHQPSLHHSSLHQSSLHQSSLASSHAAGSLASTQFARSYSSTETGTPREAARAATSAERTGDLEHEREEWREQYSMISPTSATRPGKASTTKSNFTPLDSRSFRVEIGANNRPVVRGPGGQLMELSAYLRTDPNQGF